MSSPAERFGIISSALGLVYGTVESLRRLLKLRLRLSRQHPQHQESRHGSTSEDKCIGWPETDGFSGTPSEELRSDATTLGSEPEDRQFGLECCRQEVCSLVASQMPESMTDGSVYCLSRNGTCRRGNGSWSPRFFRREETFSTMSQPVSKGVLLKKGTRTSSPAGGSSLQKRLASFACIGAGTIKPKEKRE